jgi:allantoin racemase
LSAELSRELGVPVIDGVGVAIKFAEALAGAGLSTSKRGGFAALQPHSRSRSDR